MYHKQTHISQFFLTFNKIVTKQYHKNVHIFFHSQITASSSCCCCFVLCMRQRKKREKDSNAKELDVRVKYQIVRQEGEMFTHSTNIKTKAREREILSAQKLK